MVHPEDALLRVDHLTRTFGGFVAIDDITMDIRHGELRCIIGPNGAGKTTLFNVITGRLRPSSGRVYFMDRDITYDSIETICKTGISRKFQTPSIFTNLTVLENILVAGYGKIGLSRHFFGMVTQSDRGRAIEVLERVRLEAKGEDLASSLSHGERQWLEIGMLLRNDPELLLLDEPTAGMTPSETKETAHLIKANLSGITTVVIEHDLKFLREIADQVTVLHRGSILAEGRFDDIEKNEQVKKVYLGRE
jgi:urea transport system ATP-binding protein